MYAFLSYYLHDMSSALFSIVAILPVILSAIAIYCHQRTYGTLDITTSSVAYDRAQYHNVLDWDKYALYVEGEPTMIFSGEFHYWRVPDRERWSYILKQYQSMGMNTIRIYFHWGYHSSQEGEYNFEGNRDIEYLLDLCEDLGLYVLAAPGPYICAETQAGGYPGWLIAKRHLRVRHAQYMLWRTYDEEFAQYEIEWLNHILPIIARHQITENQRSKRGCVLALQLDNELFETMAAILPIGLRDQMRVLAKAARDAGITIPLFSNDGFEESSWVARPELESRKGFWSTSAFGLDLYGFDKYVGTCPYLFTISLHLMINGICIQCFPPRVIPLVGLLIPGILPVAGKSGVQSIWQAQWIDWKRLCVHLEEVLKR